MSLENVVVTVEKDGKQKEKFIANYPNIRNLRGYLNGFWDFDKFNHLFPGRSKVADVDGSIELNGHTLHIEFKASKFAMNKGQVLKAIRQAKYSNITTLFVFGEANKPVEYIRFSPDLVEGTGYVKCTKEELDAVIKEWVEYTKKFVLVANRTEEWDITKKYC
ncbi:hypothetical protein [Priestia megaterium]|uniref:hypothetical protein n=1 Tax=Priestia megaterium TaxID=1404 RepID=UPI0023DC8CA5|nr:hypothetical protein [Priestia megaterium]MDF2010210.1 hypothetical protein [Priestia megaterium]